MANDAAEELAKQLASMDISDVCGRYFKPEDRQIEAAMAKARDRWPRPEDWRVAQKTMYSQRASSLGDFAWGSSKSFFVWATEARKGKILKGLIAEGLSPIGLVPEIEGKSPQEAAAIWVFGLTARESAQERALASRETIKALIESAARSYAGGGKFLAALASECEAVAGPIWADQDGVAGEAEAVAVARLRDPLAALKKRQALPKKLEGLAEAVERKAQALDAGEFCVGDVREEAAMAQRERERLPVLALALDRDDDELYRAVAGLAGLGEGKAKDLRYATPASYGLGRSRLLSSRALAMRSWKILGALLDGGADPWAIAQDLGQATKTSNPFAIFGASAPKESEADAETAEDLPIAARAWLEAAERGAEKLRPGEGRRLAEESLREALPEMEAKGKSCAGIFRALWQKRALIGEIGAGEEAAPAQRKPRRGM